jgi:hypothetical protein
MDNPAHRAEDRGTDSDGKQEQATNMENMNKAHAFSNYLLNPTTSPSQRSRKLSEHIESRIAREFIGAAEADDREGTSLLVPQSVEETPGL